jgi:hypothetical protein
MDWAAEDGVQGGGPGHWAAGADSLAAGATTLSSQGIGSAWASRVAGDEFTGFMPHRESRGREPRV